MWWGGVGCGCGVGVAAWVGSRGGTVFTGEGGKPCVCAQGKAGGWAHHTAHTATAATATARPAGCRLPPLPRPHHLRPQFLHSLPPLAHSPQLQISCGAFHNLALNSAG